MIGAFGSEAFADLFDKSGVALANMEAAEKLDKLMSFKTTEGSIFIVKFQSLHFISDLR